MPSNMGLMTAEKSLVQGQIDGQLKELFNRQLSDYGFTVGRAVEAMVRLWVSLPYEIQVKLYGRQWTDDSIKQFVAGIQTGQNAAGFEGKDQVQKGKKHIPPKSA